MSTNLAAPQPFVDVAHMSVPQKIRESIVRAVPLLPKEAQSFATALVSPEALETIAKTVAFWIGAHLVGVGEAADLILLLAGYVMVGKSALEASKALLAFGITAAKANSSKELDTAAEYFAKAVILAGIATVSAFLLRRASGSAKPAKLAGPVEEGTLYARTAPKLNLQIIKQLVIDAWKQPGKWPVKVFKLRGGQQVGEAVAVRGYITTERAVAGVGLRELERRLGLASGSLGDGAAIVRLDRLPNPGEFELRFYNNVHGGGVRPPSPSYPPGPGYPQWELTIDVMATITRIVK